MQTDYETLKPDILFALTVDIWGCISYPDLAAVQSTVSGKVFTAVALCETDE